MLRMKAFLIVRMKDSRKKLLDHAEHSMKEDTLAVEKEREELPKIEDNGDRGVSTTKSVDFSQATVERRSRTSFILEQRR